MNADAVHEVLARFPGTRMIEGYGDLFAIYDPDHDYEQRPRQGWATVVHSDAHDDASALEAPGRFRLNLGLPRPRYLEVVGDDETPDFTATDVVMPHPVYADYGWVCVVNPDRSWPTVQNLLVDAHDFAVRKHRNRSRRSG